MGRPAYKPEPWARQLVETLTAVGASQPAICRELARLGQPCASPQTLAKAFTQELAHGRERRVINYGLRMHALAMSDGPGAFPALKFMLGVLGGKQWRAPKDLGEDEPPPGHATGEVVHIGPVPRATQERP
jgi:hypothetical protein